jgi:transposase
MMGQQPPPQNKLFVTGFTLDKRVRENHPLRRIAAVVDFDFIYDEVRDKYGRKGNVSVPPPVILKLMLLLVFYNVRSERELMDTLPERLDWLWFLGYDLEDDVPNHSVLSKARKRWGPEVFQGFFERVVHQCVEAGLVDGSKVFVDSSLVEANASLDSVVDTGSLKEQLTEKYSQLEARLEEAPSTREAGPYAKSTRGLLSATDPDAAIVRRGDSKLRYQVHRAVDESGVITATAVTPGDVNEAHLLMDLAESHTETTGKSVETAVADSKYGTIDNYLACKDEQIGAHIPEMKDGTEKRLKKRGLFLGDRFTYDAEQDVYLCPAGQQLKYRTIHKNRNQREYKAPKEACAACELRDQCTQSKTGRTVTRHLRQEELDEMRAEVSSPESRTDLKRRQHLCEGSFGNAARYGYKRARWRRQWRVEIQNYLTCAVQNIAKIVQHDNTRREAACRASGRKSSGWGLFALLSRLLGAVTRVSSEGCDRLLPARA